MHAAALPASAGAAVANGTPIPGDAQAASASGIAAAPPSTSRSDSPFALPSASPSLTSSTPAEATPPSVSKKSARRKLSIAPGDRPTKSRKQIAAPRAADGSSTDWARGDQTVPAARTPARVDATSQAVVPIPPTPLTKPKSTPQLQPEGSTNGGPKAKKNPRPNPQARMPKPKAPRKLSAKAAPKSKTKAKAKAESDAGVQADTLAEEDVSAAGVGAGGNMRHDAALDAGATADADILAMAVVFSSTPTPLVPTPHPPTTFVTPERRGQEAFKLKAPVVLNSVAPVAMPKVLTPAVAAAGARPSAAATPRPIHRLHNLPASSPAAVTLVKSEPVPEREAVSIWHEDALRDDDRDFSPRQGSSPAPPSFAPASQQVAANRDFAMSLPAVPRRTTAASKQIFAAGKKASPAFLSTWVPSTPHLQPLSTTGEMHWLEHYMSLQPGYAAFEGLRPADAPVRRTLLWDVSETTRHALAIAPLAKTKKTAPYSTEAQNIGIRVWLQFYMALASGSRMHLVDSTPRIAAVSIVSPLFAFVTATLPDRPLVHVLVSAETGRIIAQFVDGAHSPKRLSAAWWPWMEAVQARCAVKGVADSLVALIPDIEEGFPHGVHPRCPPEHRKTARRVMLSQVHTGFLHPLQILLTFEQGNGVTAVVLPAEQSCEPHRGSHANGLNPSKKLISLDTDPRDVMLNGSVWLLIVSPGFGIEHVTDKGLAAGLSSVQTTSGELLVLMETGGALASIEHGELPRLWRMLLRCDERGRSCPPTTLPLVVSPEMQTFFALPE